MITLHTIPDGKPCPAHHLQRHQFIEHDGAVWVYNPNLHNLVRITDNAGAEIPDGALYQPVRLEVVP